MARFCDDWLGWVTLLQKAMRSVDKDLGYASRVVPRPEAIVNVLQHQYFTYRAWVIDITIDEGAKPF